MDIVRRFCRIPAQSCFLLGPRGVGKSTWLRRKLPDALLLDLADPALHRRLAARPERLRQLLAGSPTADTIVVDDVQRVPELLKVVHTVLAGPAPPRFVLAASSAHRLRPERPDLFGGRVPLRTLHPFMATELPRFSLDAALQTGMLPLVVGAPDPAASLGAYAGLCLEQEIRAGRMTRDVGAFARFLEAVSFSHGALLNAAETARECKVERKTVVRYVELLEELLLAFRLPVFRKRVKRATVARRKFYFFDAGVFRSLRPAGLFDRPGEIDGQALEGLVAQHLRAWAAYSGQGARLCFWRTRAGTEVDFVVDARDGLHAFDVRNSARVDSRRLRPLRAFLDEYREATAVLLHRGRKRLRVDGIWCLPVEEFLRGLVPGQSLLAGRGLLTAAAPLAGRSRPRRR